VYNWFASAHAFRPSSPGHRYCPSAIQKRQSLTDFGQEAPGEPPNSARS